MAPVAIAENFFSSRIYRNSTDSLLKYLSSSRERRSRSVQLLIKWTKMSTPMLSKFLCCFELRIGGFLIGSIDSILYGVIILVFSLQLFFDVEFIDKKHGEECLQNFVFWFLSLMRTYMHFDFSLRIQRSVPIDIFVCFIRHLDCVSFWSQTGEDVNSESENNINIEIFLAEKFSESLSISDSYRMPSLCLSFH